MKKTILFLACLMAMTSSFGQKVKLKKGMVLVDKQEQFKFEKTKDGKLLKGTIPHYMLSDLEGNPILVLTDTLVNFTQIPSETEPRRAYRTYVCTNPKNNKSTVVAMPRALNARKIYIKDLKDLGFFKSGEMTDEIYEGLVQKQDLEWVENWKIHLDSTNVNRVRNYELVKEKLGEPTKRKPRKISVSGGQIKDGLTVVGKFLMKKKGRGSYAHIYRLEDAKGKEIGQAALFVTESRGNTKVFSDDVFKTFDYKTKRDGTSMTTDEKLQVLAEYLIIQGYL